MLSLGGGTQSTVLALLADQEVLGPKPDIAIFADTDWEPEAVYQNITWLRDKLSYPVVTVTNGRSLRDDVISGTNTSGAPWLTIPVWLSDLDGNPAGVNWRQCTSNYKVAPIQREVRRRLGLAHRSPVPATTLVEMWLGITTDESERMRTAQEPWIVNRYPLIDANMSRDDCIDWFNAEYPTRNLPRSACIGCPFHSDDAWIAIRNTDPDAYAEAIMIDTMLRNDGHNAARMFRKQAFLHHRRLPLSVAVERSEKDRQEATHWSNECVGLCGI